MPISPRQRKFGLLLLTAGGLAAAFGAGMWMGQQRSSASVEWVDTRLLSLAIDSVRVNALDSLPSDELIRRAVAGMLRELHDPYAELLQKDGMQRYRGSVLGDGDGYGLTLRWPDARGGDGSRVGRELGAQATVVAVVRGSPAQYAGVRVGDRILSVDSLPAREVWARDRDSNEVRPERSIISVWRAKTGDTLSLVLERSSWHRPAVSDVGMLSDSLGYVRMRSMTARSSEELEQAVEDVVRRGARGLVLDLRGNGGGLFEEGIKAAGLFLPRGVIAASLAGRNGMAHRPYRVVTSRWPLMPLTVLVDGGTASSAEVLAAALRDHKRALLVGSPTYGKGVVQRVVTLSGDLSLRLTTARWITPNGEVLARREGNGAASRGGIAPDVLVDDAGRKDAAIAPSYLPGDMATRMGQIADSLALQAVAEGWSVAPLAMLEARVRMVASRTPKQAMLQGLDRAEWTGILTRISVARILEIEQPEEAKLRYGINSDAALRAAIDALSPGVTSTDVFPLVLPSGQAVGRN